MTDRHDRCWRFAAVVMMIVVLFGLRWTSDIQATGPIFDEEWITVPINDLIEQGWSVETAIDFEETKGPALIWPYAAIGKLLGGTLNDLRLISLWSTVLGGGVLVVLAGWCGVRRWGYIAIAWGWLLLPYLAVFSQLVMGEASFILLEMLMVAAFVWGVRRGNRVTAPILYGLLLTIALHSRIHAVAVAGGVCIAALASQGVASWPWWVASIVAGLLRIPLWVRWDGLVSPKFQNLHGLGLRLESLTYLAAAMAPLVGVFVLAAWRRGQRRWIVAGGVVGAMLGVLAMPDLSLPQGMDLSVPHARFQGIAATLVKQLASGDGLRQVLLGGMAVLGLAGLAGLWASSRKFERVSTLWLLVQVQAWTLVAGWGLYAVTRGFVFDRFLLVWAMLLPVIWFRVLPRWLQGAQCIVLAVIAVRLCGLWLYEQPC
jgi:hypothetical protein